MRLLSYKACHCAFGVMLAGFEVIDVLAREAGIDCRKLEKSAAVGKGELCGKQVSMFPVL